MSLFTRLTTAATAAVVVVFTGCSAANLSPTQSAAPQGARFVVHSAYGIGPIVQPKLAGTILGFDVDQHGTDGVLANYSGRSFRISLETFDQTTGKITKMVGEGPGTKTDYVVLGILAHDVGLVYHNNYRLMNPVTGEKLNGTWNPPSEFEPTQVAENQNTPESVMLGYDLGSASQPTELVASDVVRGTSRVIPLNQDVFGTGAIPVIAQDSATNQAVIAAQDGSRYTHPTIGIIDLKSGRTTTFTALGYGDVDGIGVDTKTGVACTTTGIDAGVEFYNLKTQTGFEVQIPQSGGSELRSGAGLAVDSVHSLCIVAQPVSGEGTQASAMWVVDEKGNFLEEIEGFNFWFGVWPSINPEKRIGYIANPRPEYATLTGFSY
jgi:hypothetical protein